MAGLEIVEVRISHLAYAPEIAGAMLQRQQAGAIIAARSRIVEGAVGMVELALARLEEGAVVELDDERKAAMVSNLLVVLCGDQKTTPIVGTVLLVLLAGLVLSSLTVVQPGQTQVVQFFGRYVGTARRTGLLMTVPLSTKRRVSVRVNNFETSALKVNDFDGNPVEIAAIVVWQVADTAKAVFAVEDHPNFIRVQSEAALRHVATTHPYDDPDGSGTSLRGSTDVVSAQLAQEVAERVAVCLLYTSRCV